MKTPRLFSAVLVTLLAILATTWMIPPSTVEANCETDLSIVNNSNYPICIELIVKGCICSPAVCVPANTTLYLQVGEDCCFVAARYKTSPWCTIASSPCPLPPPWSSIDVTECTITIN